MNDKLLRSSTRHSVAYDETTKNATSPHHALDKAGSQSEAIHDHLIPMANPASAEAILHELEDHSKQTKDARAKLPVDGITAQAPASVPQKNLKSNFQKFEVEDPTDSDKFYESLHKLKDQLHHFKESHLQQNRQRIPTETQVDNYQKIDSVENFTDRVEYLGKKNIKDHRIQIDNLQHHLSDAELTKTEFVQEDISPISSSKINHHASQVSIDPTGHQHQLDLQERINRLRKDVGEVNESLKDIEDQSE